MFGRVQRYNQWGKWLMSDAYRQWDDAADGNLFFCLATNGYTPVGSHTTTADVAGLVTAGDGAPIAATGLIVDSDNHPPGVALISDDVDFGDITLQPKWLLCVQPVTANSFSNTTSRLLWYLDLAVEEPYFDRNNQLLKIRCPRTGWIMVGVAP